MVKDSLEQIIAEKDLLFSCRTNKGFAERLSTRFLPKLRAHSDIATLIKDWEKIEIQEESLKQQAYKELARAFIEVKEVLTNLEAKGMKIFSDKECKITVLEDILNAICSENSFLSCREPPYTRVYYKIRASYVNNISKSHEIEFAPSALALIEKDKLTNFLASGDCDPSFLWRYLTSIERAWTVAGNRHSIGWGKIPVDDETMWLNSDTAFRTAFRNYVANELWNSDEPSYRNEFYRRPQIESLIDRLLKEIALIIANSSPTLEVSKNRKHPHTQKKDEDLEIFLPLAKKKWLEEIPCSICPRILSPLALAKSIVKSLPISASLHAKEERRITRAKLALKMTDPREFDKKTGDYIGLKNHWEKFGWVKI